MCSLLPKRRIDLKSSFCSVEDGSGWNVNLGAQFPYIRWADEDVGGDLIL